MPLGTTPLSSIATLSGSPAGAKVVAVSGGQDKLIPVGGPGGLVYNPPSGPPVGVSGLLNGAPVVVTGAGAGTYTTRAGTNSILVELVGGGGGGGGAPTAASSASAGGGGGGGGYVRKYFAVAPLTEYAYHVGAGGAGGFGADGNIGTQTDFTVGGVTPFAGPGSPGRSMAAGSTAAASAIALGGSGTLGDVNVGGSPGLSGFIASGTVGFVGAGGPSTLGGGGAGRIAAGDGAPGRAYGGGGGGALVLNGSSAGTGGNGADGAIIVWEYT